MTTIRKPKLLGICGSLRKNSSNRKLLRVAIQGAGEAGAEVTEVDLLDHPLAAFNEDDQLREGVPENARKLRRLMLDCDGALFAVPEYNTSLPGGFKNVLDWMSRKDPSGPFARSCFEGKFAAIMGASSGAFGARRSLSEMRHILHMLGMHVIPEQVSLPHGREAFDEAGNLKDESRQKAVAAVAARLVEVVSRLAF